MERLMFDTETARWECEIAQYDVDHLRLRQVAMILKSLSVESVFDIGCGHGHLGSLLPGVDYSGCDMIDGAGSSFPFTRCNVNRDGLPQQIRGVSAVSCSGLLEYVDDLPQFLRELRARMRSGSWLVVTYLNMNHLSRIFAMAVGRTFDVHPGWRGFYSPRSLGHLLNASGFKLETSLRHAIWVGGTSTPRYRLGATSPASLHSRRLSSRSPAPLRGAGRRMTLPHGVHAEEIGALKRQFVETLRHAIGDSTHVAILDFPFHPNCGDSLIYLGELAALKEIGVDILAVSDADGFRPEHYLSLPPDTVMLFHGGGNFGGLWDTPHLRRNEELQQLRSFKAVMLPQTMTTMDEECRQQTRAVLASHSDVTLMWRDRKSFETSLTLFPEVQSVLVPDAAFCLFPLPRPRVTLRAKERVSLLARRDREGSGLANAVNGAIPVRDWECVFVEKAVRRLLRFAIKRERSAPGRPRMKLRGRLFYAYAHLNGRSAARQLKSNDVVVVDRLHAWILSVLLGVPHVVVDTKYEKISAVMSSWLPGELDTLATAPDDSLVRARVLAA